MDRLNEWQKDFINRLHKENIVWRTVKYLIIIIYFIEIFCLLYQRNLIQREQYKLQIKQSKELSAQGERQSHILRILGELRRELKKLR